jgi:hypothetical protein
LHAHALLVEATNKIFSFGFFVISLTVLLKNSKILEKMSKKSKSVWVEAGAEILHQHALVGQT